MWNGVLRNHHGQENSNFNLDWTQVIVSIYIQGIQLFTTALVYRNDERKVRKGERGEFQLETKI